MADRKALFNPTLTINDLDVKYKPNTLSYTEGFGEYKVRARSGGGGSTDTVFSKDIETQIGKLKFNIFPTKDLLELIRLWKSLNNANVITLTDTAGESRTFKFAAMVNDPDVNVGADTDVEINFESDPPQ